MVISYDFHEAPHWYLDGQVRLDSEEQMAIVVIAVQVGGKRPGKENGTRRKRIEHTDTKPIFTHQREKGKKSEFCNT